MRNIFKNFLAEKQLILKGKVNILVNSWCKGNILPVNNPENPF